MIQRLTIFGDDDLTPLLGAVDGGGNVTDPTFSTDAAHVRPYLKVGIAPSRDAEPTEGRVGIGQSTVEVVDKRRTADQSTGIFTWLLAAANGDTALLGRRVRWEQEGYVPGTWDVLLDGSVYDVKLLTDGNYVTYRITLRDARERERNVRAFTKVTDTAIFPYVAPVGGYGYQTKVGAGPVLLRVLPTLPAVDGVKCQYHSRGTAGGFIGGYFDVLTAEVDRLKLVDRTRQLREVWEKAGELVPDQITDTGAPWAPSAHRWRNVQVQWSTDNATWHTITSPYGIAVNSSQPGGILKAGGTGGSTNLFQFRNWGGVVSHADVVHRIQFGATTADQAAGHVPADGAVVYVRVLAYGVPSEEAPLYWEGRFGELLKKLYDGDFSEVNPRIRYDAAAMQAFIDATPYTLVKVTKPTDDVREWARANIYRVLGAIPVMTRDGKIAPKLLDLPGPDVPLLTLNDANTFPAGSGWAHGVGNVVNKVTFLYKRDVVGAPLSSMGGIVEQTVDVQYLRASSAAMFGAKEASFEPDTCRAVVVGDSGVPLTGDTSQDVGARLAAQRAVALVDRFGSGAQEATIRASMADAGVRAAQEGDWVVLGVSWLPDYQTRVRGISRLMQIIRIRPTENPGIVEFGLLDAGPFAQPVAQITTANGRIEGSRFLVDVTALPAGVEGQLQYAYGDVQPDATSGEWRDFARATAIGTYQTPENPAGMRVWARWRGVATGKRPSAWTVMNLLVPTIASLADFRVRVTEAGQVEARWVRRSGKGVRVYFKTFAKDDPAPTSVDGTWSSADFDGPPDVVTLPITLRQYENIVVQAEAWTALVDMTMLHIAGERSLVLFGQRRDPNYTPIVVLDRRQQSSTIATVGLTVTDPGKVVTSVEFRFSADGGATWFAWSPTAVPPEQSEYLLTTSIPADNALMVQWRVNGYGPDGTVQVLAAGTQGFTRVIQGVIRTVVTLDTALSNATENVYEVSATDPFGTVGPNAPKVSLQAVYGSATLKAGETPVGTQVASPAKWRIVRGPAAADGGSAKDGFALFRGSSPLAGILPHDVPVTVPPQGQNTIALIAHAVVSSVTDTQVIVDVSVDDPVPQTATLGANYITITPSLDFSGSVTPSTPVGANPGNTIQFTFTRAAFGNFDGIGRFAITAPNRVTAYERASVPAKMGVNRLNVQVELIAPPAGQETTHVRARVYVVDPAPQGANTCTITVYTSNIPGAVTPPSPISSGTPTTLFSTTGYIDFTIPRPAKGSYEGSVEFYVQDTTGKREPVSATVPIAPIAAQGNVEVRYKLISSDALWQTYEITGVDDAGSATGVEVALLSVAGGAVFASSSTHPTYVVGSWVTGPLRVSMQRGAAGSGPGTDGTIELGARKTGYVEDRDTAIVPGQGKDTVPLVVRAVVTQTFADRVEVNVKVIDGVPQGGSYITLTIASATGVGTITVGGSPATDWVLPHNGSVTYVIYRGGYKGGVGRVNFRAYIDPVNGGAGRVEDSDSVDVPTLDASMTLGVRIVRQAAADASNDYLRIFAVDPIPQGANTITLYEKVGTAAEVNIGTIGTVTADFATTGYIDRTIAKPTSEMGVVVSYRAVASGRADGSASTTVDAGSPPVISGVVISVNATTDEVTISWSYTGSMSGRYWDVYRATSAGSVLDTSTWYQAAITSSSPLVDTAHGFDIVSSGGFLWMFGYNIVATETGTGRVISQSGWQAKQVRVA